MSKIHRLVRLLDRVLSQRPEEVRRGIDRAARAADRRTGGKYRSQIERGTRLANRYLESRSHRRHTRHW